MKRRGKKRTSVKKWELIENDKFMFFQFKSGKWIMGYSTISTGEGFLEYFKPILVKQIHSDIIIDIDQTKNRTGDGMITSKKNSVLGIKIADCLPVFLFNKQKFCMIHCGWQGIIKKIIQKAKLLMGEYEYVLGACIGPCCYEVGDDIAKLFTARHKDAVVFRNNKYYVDLKAAAIEDLGEDRLIGNLDLCTKCHPEYFYSYRRGDKNRRNYSIAMVAEREY
ncbi:MAG: polyphenol oxidase family protein [bacterium]